MSKAIFLCAATALATLFACTNETDTNEQSSGTDGGRMTFTVNMPGTAGWIKQHGSRSAANTETSAPIEMDGKVNGQAVYLQAEVTDGFPGDEHRPLSRGTIINEANKETYMTNFGVTAYYPKDSADFSKDYMYNVKTTKDASANTWSLDGNYFWPTGKQLNFYAWYPYTAEGLFVSKLSATQGGDYNTHAALQYDTPNDVTKQVDLMTAVALNENEAESTTLTFKHILSAVRFVASKDLGACTIKSITMGYTIQYGAYDINTNTWNTDGGGGEGGNANYTITPNKVLDGTADTEVTAEDQTFFLIPQTINDWGVGNTLEIVINDGTSDYTIGASLHGTKFEAGKTYTYKISYGWRWEEPLRNLPTGKQLLTNEAHTLVYDFALSDGKMQPASRKGKFVITPIYPDGTVASSAQATEVPFNLSREQTKTTLNLDANPNYNLLRMIQIKVTNPDGTEKTLGTVDFQEAKTDANKIVIYPSIYNQTKNTTLAENAVFSDYLTNATPSLTGELSGCSAAYASRTWKGMINKDNADAAKLSYLKGDASGGIYSSHPKKTCYGDVTITMEWCLGYEDEDPNANYIPQYVTTSTSTNIDGRKTTNNRTDKSFNFTVNQIDIQKAGLARQGTGYRLTNNHASRYWSPVSASDIVNGAKGIGYWGYIGCLDYWDGSKNSTQIRVCGYGASSICSDVIAWWLDHLHTFGCKARVIMAHWDNPNSDTDGGYNLTGRFYWSEVYKIKNIYWTLYRQEAGIAENAETDMNKQTSSSGETKPTEPTKPGTN